MQISKDLEIEVVEDCVHIIEHTQFDGDVFIIVEPEEISALISALQEARLTLRAVDAAPEQPSEDESNQAQRH